MTLVRITRSEFAHRNLAEVLDKIMEISKITILRRECRMSPGAFTAFANQPPGYYTPPSGGANALYHSQAGDLHTPNMGIGVGTPLSLPATTAPGLHGFTQQTIQSQQFHNFDPFAQNTFAPDQFTEQPSGFEPIDASADVPPIRNIGMDTDMQEDSPIMSFHPRHFDACGATLPPNRMENFRFHATLHAPTAMVKHADEIPVTYLNKGQAYSLTIIDTASPIPDGLPLRYRTFVRISFEDEQQRQRPGACWQLWKEGRGTTEARQRGGKLQAVEYVDTSQPSEDDRKHTRAEIETASLDGFSVIWSPGPNRPADCSVAVRFNFLSTDFSHSKGVKGIPVRLCAKTEVIRSDSHLPSSPEICYCKVKLFRDHGAERKLSNDIVHVRKTIDKLKQQISQVDTGIRDFGRKKRQNSGGSKGTASSKTGKVPKHKRTWSMSSASSSGGGRLPAEEDLQLKLAIIQDMFTSTQTVSVLYLRGSEPDDPDLHPVRLLDQSRDPTSHERKDIVWNRRQSVAASNTTGTPSLISPSPSSTSLQSQGITGVGFALGGSNQLGQGLNDWSNFQPLSTADLRQSPNPQHLASPPDQPVRVPKSTSSSTGDLSVWIEALGVDSSYRAPSERPTKPSKSFLLTKRRNDANMIKVACVYIIPAKSERPSKVEYYRAVYLMERTVRDLTVNIAAKFGIDPTSVLRTTYVNSRGLSIVVDNDVVREIPEGQDMRIEIAETKPDAQPVKREWHIGPGEDDNDIGSARATDGINSPRFEIKLLF
ncbi:hypothetical protein FGG08_003214 [Glutinoglossum americanum]|uniref:Grh/CP2 DB domain-containing protein n=1 Tax=Glutinoglossum americanum TaxID=1670608 RepID=A0A9P8I7Q3_9PEZI|nr:hypothetical protein FGG08_003214 [Glutinoglossum americanum]